MSKSELSELREIEFDKLQLDPNNPRIAPRDPPGYADASKLFDPARQASLTDEVFNAYNADDLEKVITNLGWAPVDPILVWRHPDRKDLAVVVEGNTRTSILRRSRTHLATMKAKLAIAQQSGRQSLISEVQGEVDKVQALVNETQKIRVQFVQADTAEDLAAKLPRLLGVRHVSGARNWSPYATNIYISDLYEKMFSKAFPKDKLRLVDALVNEAAQIFSLRPDQARKRIQAVSMFVKFKLDYNDKIVAVGNTLLDEDQYFFDQIMQSSHARTQFEIDKDSLQLSEKASEALFQWAFSKSRKTPNENVLRKAEDIRVWQSLSKYDGTNSTKFASMLDVDNPADAPTLRTLDNRRSNHEEQMSPLNTLAGLIEAFDKLPAVNLVTQSDMLQPLLVQIRDASIRFLAMIGHGKPSEPS